MTRKLQNFRQEANLSREELAVASKVGYATICRAEQQRGSISLPTVMKLAEFFADELPYSYEFILKRLATSHCKALIKGSSKKKSSKRKPTKRKPKKK